MEAEGLKPLQSEVKTGHAVRGGVTANIHGSPFLTAHLLICLASEDSEALIQQQSQRRVNPAPGGNAQHLSQQWHLP